MPWANALILDPAIAPAETLGVTVVWFFVSTLLLDWFDISLPRGDSIGVSGALCSAALLHLGPVIAFPLCLASLTLAYWLKPGERPARWIVNGLVARLLSLSVGALAMLLLGVGGSLEHRYSVAIFVPALFLLSELFIKQFEMAIASNRPLGRLIRGNLVVQAPLLVAEWSASVLLLITLEGMGSWSLIPVVALLLLIRQSYALLLDIRETYRTTVEVLVEAAEGQDSRLVGHAERTAVIARRIAMRVGLTVPQVELISYAALLHDIDALGGDGGNQSRQRIGHSSAVFEGVDFFADVLPILRVCDGDFGEEHVHDERALLAGLIVALASDADAVESTGVLEAHAGSLVARVSPGVSSATKARVVAAALSLGYKTPAVS